FLYILRNNFEHLAQFVAKPESIQRVVSLVDVSLLLSKLEVTQSFTLPSIFSFEMSCGSFSFAISNKDKESSARDCNSSTKRKKFQKSNIDFEDKQLVRKELQEVSSRQI